MKTYKIRRYLKLFGENLLETHKIGRDLAKSCRDLVQIRREPARSCRDLAKFQRIWPNIGHISTNSARYQPDLIRTGQNNGIRDKNWNWPMNSKTRRNPNRPIRLAFRVGFGFYFDSLESFGSGPGRAQTRPVDTSSYSIGFIVGVFFFFFIKEEEIWENKNVRLE